MKGRTQQTSSFHFFSIEKRRLAVFQSKDVVRALLSRRRSSRRRGSTTLGGPRRCRRRRRCDDDDRRPRLALLLVRARRRAVRDAAPRRRPVCRLPLPDLPRPPLQALRPGRRALLPRLLLLVPALGDEPLRGLALPARQGPLLPPARRRRRAAPGAGEAVPVRVPEEGEGDAGGGGGLEHALAGRRRRR